MIGGESQERRPGLRDRLLKEPAASKSISPLSVGATPGARPTSRTETTALYSDRPLERVSYLC